MTDFTEFLLRQQIGHLPKDKQLAFAVILCERMFSPLDQFGRATGFDSSIYRTCLDDAWRHLELIKSVPAYGELAERCLDHAPDTEEFNHPLTSAALSCALAVAATMGFLADGDIDHVAEVTDLALDTAALYAEPAEATPLLSSGLREIMKHPLVQRELQQQAKDLEFIESLPADAFPKMTSVVKEFAARTPAMLPKSK